MTLTVGLIGMAIAGWLVRYFTGAAECTSCLNKHLQRREWNRTAHLDPWWDAPPRGNFTPETRSMPPGSLPPPRPKKS